MKQIFLLIGLITFFHADAWSQTTEFTYQGNLRVGPSPAIASATTVNYDFDFRLCTTDTSNCTMAPGLIGIDQHPNVPVTDGIFTVKLTFSAANAFDGSPRWLQIAIKPAGDPGGYLVLSPRQQLTGTPYAIKSKNADQLGGVPATQYLQTNGNGSGLTNLNAGNITNGTLAIANGGTGSATKNFVDLSTDQTSIGGHKTFAGNLFVNGNLGVGTSSPGGKFHINVPGSGNPITALTLDVGTFGTGTNAVNSYYFKAQDLGAPGTPAFLIRGDGNVGIGTATPSSKLHVSGTGSLRITADSDSIAGFGLRLSNSPKWSLATGFPGQFQIVNDAIGQSAVWIDPANNNVGIGSTSPAATLEVNGFTKLGSDAPSIRVKKLVGVTAITQGGRTTILHGLDGSKILSVSVMVNWGGTEWIGPNHILTSGDQFDWILTSGAVIVDLATGNSADIVSKPIKILITYEQ